MSLPTDRYVCEITFFVRYAETDQMGIVHHSNYLVWCEELRSQYTRDKGASYADFEKDGLALAVSEVNLRYLAPAYYGDQVTLQGWPVEVKSRRVTFSYQVLNHITGQLLMTGTTKHICVNRQGQVARIPEQWLRLWGTE